jgi:hypothetical protein
MKPFTGDPSHDKRLSRNAAARPRRKDGGPSRHNAAAHTSSLRGAQRRGNPAPVCTWIASLRSQ